MTSGRRALLALLFINLTGAASLVNADGAFDPQTGQYFPEVAGGVLNPRTGQVYIKVAGGYINPVTGQFYPAIPPPASPLIPKTIISPFSSGAAGLVPDYKAKSRTSSSSQQATKPSGRVAPVCDQLATQLAAIESELDGVSFSSEPGSRYVALYRQAEQTRHRFVYDCE